VCFTIPYKENLKLINIKKEVHHQLGIKPEKQRLICNCKELSGDDDRYLSDLDLWWKTVLKFNLIIFCCFRWI
jgi:hypothetical protein